MALVRFTAGAISDECEPTEGAALATKSDSGFAHLLFSLSLPPPPPPPLSLWYGCPVSENIPFIRTIFLFNSSTWCVMTATWPHLPILSCTWAGRSVPWCSAQLLTNMGDGACYFRAPSLSLSSLLQWLSPTRFGPLSFAGALLVSSWLAVSWACSCWPRNSWGQRRGPWLEHWFGSSLQGHWWSWDWLPTLSGTGGLCASSVQRRGFLWCFSWSKRTYVCCYVYAAL